MSAGNCAARLRLSPTRTAALRIRKSSSGRKRSSRDRRDRPQLDLRLRPVYSSYPLVTTIAGNGRAGFSGDGGPAVNASFGGGFFGSHLSIALDSTGNLFIADKLNNRIRMVDARTRVITTVADNGRLASSGALAILPLAAVVTLIGLLSAQTTSMVGYAVYTADSGSKLPGGSALFRVSDSSGVVISEAGVGAAEPMLKGRIFVDEVGTRMGLAIVNANPASASITFTLRDTVGAELARKSSSLGANQHLSTYVADLFPAESVGLRGSLTFESSQPLAAVTVRQNQNSRGESLYTTLPVINLAAAPSTTPVVFPHIAAGGGNTTQVLLMNPTSSAISGEIAFYDSAGKDVSRTPYTISGNGTFRTALTSSVLISGWAQVIPASSNVAPSGGVVFQVQTNDQVVSEAGVGATKATRIARIFVDNAQTQTGVAIVNPSTLTANLTLTLMDRNGNVQETQTRTVSAGNHFAFYVNDIFSTLTDSFTGLMEIRSSVDVASVTLKLTVNTRGDLIATTLPVADVTNPPSATMMIFPQIAIGGAFSTRLILINTDSAAKASGRLSFYQSDSTNMVIPMGDQTGSSFLYQVSAGGGRQFYPGNSARVQVITLVDGSSNTETRELVVNEGNTVRPSLRIVDSAGQSRDDFDAVSAVSNADIATVNADGSIAGKRPGFSTLTISAGGAVFSGTLTVVRVESGARGFGTVGVVQDFAQRLYLASSQDHTVLLAETVRQTPAPYAGISGSPGLKNDLRLQSQFHGPAFLALNQFDGSLYVTDSANNVVRRVRPGVAGRVDTLAGTGSAGSSDGALAQAQFNAPQGIALDSRGYLWIADSGNHTIRRINLAGDTVETIAGAPGIPGFADGTGSAARFRSPTGIAVEGESVVQQLDRERRGLPPPPVSVIVADTANGVLRRVRENGSVETLIVSNLGATTVSDASHRLTAAPGTPFTFDNPSGVLVDASQNIFVTEPGARRVRIVLQSQNEVVTATQSGTFLQPRGLTATSGGTVIVADGAAAANQLSYGAPQITSVTPSSISDRGGDRVTIRGSNFASDSVLVVAGTIISAVVQNTETITFTAPALSSGRTTITVQNRGGIGQSSLTVEPTPLSQLQAGYITTVAGGATFAGDGGPGAAAGLSGPKGLAADPAGNLYVADAQQFRIRRVDARTGLILTVAGNGLDGFFFFQEGLNALTTALPSPVAVTADGRGNTYFADNFQIYKVDASTRAVSRFARVAFVGHMIANAAGDLLITESFGSNVYKVNAANGAVTVYAGGGAPQSGVGDGLIATQASLSGASGIALDASGNLYIADSLHFRIRKVDAQTQVITTVAADISQPRGLALDDAGNLYIGSLFGQILRLDTSGSLTTLRKFSGEPTNPEHIIVGADRNLYVTSTDTNQILKVDTKSGAVTVAIGCANACFIGDGGPAVSATLTSPSGIAARGSGDLVIADKDGQRIRRVDNRTVSTAVGDGRIGHIQAPDGVTGAQTSLFFPEVAAANAAGTVYYVDSNRLRRIDPVTQLVQTVVTTSTSGSIQALAFDAAGSLYAATSSAVTSVGDFVVKITGSTMTPVVGTAGKGYSGDNGPATSATLNNPTSIAFDGSGNLFIADRGNGRVRKVDTNATITTVAGGGTATPSNNLSATQVKLNPKSVATDSQGNLFILEEAGIVYSRIYKVTPAGVISLIANSTSPFKFSGDNGPATSANFDGQGISTDAAGNIYVADRHNGRVRAIKGPF